jgi:hypothetical protein
VAWRSAALVALSLFVSACSTEDERSSSLDQDAGGSPRETVGQTETAMDFEVLAEDFHDAGYTTASFSANAMIDADFGFDRGFDTFESPDLIEIMKARRLGETHERFRLLDRLREWNDQRDKSRPYFLFVNIFDAHDPYAVRDTNAWVPEDVSHSEIEFIASKYEVPRALCDAVPIKKHLEVLRGLYMGNVSRADENLGVILKIVEEGDEVTPRIVVATSDHGEHLGENRLMGHRFSVRNAALHIPLIVTGLPGVRPAAIEEPVELRSVRASLLCWALGRSCSEALPTESDANRSQAIFSLYSDSVVSLPQWMLDRLDMKREDEVPSRARARCRDEDLVFGDMVSMIRYPMKITWFSNNDPVLHDLSWDPAERSNQILHQPDLAASLIQEVEAFVRKNVLEREEPIAPALSEEAAQRLKELGYIH